MSWPTLAGSKADVKEHCESLGSIRRVITCSDLHMHEFRQGHGAQRVSDETKSRIQYDVMRAQLVLTFGQLHRDFIHRPALSKTGRPENLCFRDCGSLNPVAR